MTTEIENVIPYRDSTKWSIMKMTEVLEKQGQIEPLQVKFHHFNSDGSEVYKTFESDAWGAEIVLAARVLNWTTLLIHVTDRYEE